MSTPTTTKDPRFARLATDPRFLRPSKLKNKVVLDERFRGILEEGSEYTESRSKVDKYGRKVGKDASKDELRQFYRLDDGPEEGKDGGEGEDSEEQRKQKKGSSSNRNRKGNRVVAVPPKIIDRARGEGLSESSSEEEEDDDDDDDDDNLDGGSQDTSDDSNSDSDSDADEQQRRRRASSEISIDLDEDAPVPSTSRTSATAQVESSIPTMEGSTKRIAIVNLDWDNVRAVDLYKVFESVLSPSAAAAAASAAAFTATATPGNGHDASMPAAGTGLGSRKSKSKIAKGRVVSVKIYPSEFGKQRLEREEREGPPVEIFSKKKARANAVAAAAASLGTAKKGKKQQQKKKKKRRAVGEDLGEDEDDAFSDGSDLLATDGGEEYDEQALRRYQLERLRYYYAVVEFDTPSAAQHAYQEIDSTEFEATANVFDLRYVPDEVSFDDTPTDSATPATVDMQAYKPLEFVTDALRNSKVKLTWDADDPERAKITRATHDKSKKDKGKKEEAIDYSKLLATDSEAEDEAAMSRMRAAFGLDPTKRASGDAGDDDSDDDDDAFFDTAGSNVFDGDRKNEMEVTFTPALSGNLDSDDDDENKDETSLEKYQRKERERRAAKKEKRKLEKKRAAGGARSRLVGEEDEDSDPDEAFDANKIAELGLSEDEDVDDDDDDVAVSTQAAASKKKKKGKRSDGFFDFGDGDGTRDDGEAIDSSAKLSKKAQKQLEREAKEKELASLSLLVSGDGDGDDSNDEAGGKHFDMQQILKAEKISSKPKKVLKKGKDRRKHAEAKELLDKEKDKFTVDLADERFSKLHQDHEFALDPSNPKFMKTKNMQRILAESRKRRDVEQPNGEELASSIPKDPSGDSLSGAGSSRDGLSSLVESIKRKNRTQDGEKNKGKRQKRS